jgi:hypothetical protein
MGQTGNLKAIEMIFNYAFGKHKDIGGIELNETMVIRPKSPKERLNNSAS